MGVNDHVTTILGIVISLLAFSAVFIALRVYTRLLVRKGAFGWDDVLIVLTWVITLAYNICIFVAVHYGYGHHSQEISPPDLVRVIKFALIGQALAMAAFPPGKASVAILLMRVFPSKPARCVLWMVVILNIVLWYTSAILLFVQCDPLSKAWNYTLLGTCWDPRIINDLGIAAGALGSASDFLLAAIPWWYIKNLHMNPREKLGLGIALSLGFIAGIFSIVKTYYLSRVPHGTDLIYDTTPTVLWTCAELCAIAVAACIPTLRPLLQKLTHSPLNQPDATTTPKQPDFGNLERKQLYHVEVNASHVQDRKGSTRSLLPTVKKKPSDRHILVEQTFMVERAEDLEANGGGDWYAHGIAGRNASVEYGNTEVRAVEHI